MILITNNPSKYVYQLMILVSVLVLSLFLNHSVNAEDKNAETNITTTGKIKSPGADLWRDVRQRNGAVKGNSQIQRADSGTMIDTSGEEWRQLRVEKIIPYSAYLLGFVILAIFLFRLIRGEIKIAAGRSGERILRFTFSQRFIHWCTAVLFLILAFTGIILLLGRSFLLPIVGSNTFSIIASTGKFIHNYCGPVFAILLLLMLIHFIKGNFYKLSDLKWFTNGGGLFGKHASSGKYNAGEKSWFWVLMLGGAAVIGTGLVLDFPIFEQTKDTLRLMQIIHGIASVILFAVALGHIYMGTIAMEGALETMKTGYCDANWAKEHHDEWYEEVKATTDSSPSNNKPS